MGIIGFYRHYGPRAVMIHGVPVKTYNALQNHIIVLLIFWFFGFLQVRFSELGLCKWDSDWFFKYSLYLFINSNPRKIQYYSTLSLILPPDGWIQHLVPHGKLL